MVDEMQLASIINIYLFMDYDFWILIYTLWIMIYVLIFVDFDLFDFDFRIMIYGL